MASVKSLRKRIEELSAAIKHHEEIIRGLEKAKSEARGQLNGILDPLTQCPLEISSEIFLLCLPSTPSFNPLVFLRVCRSWRDIAFATPSLWAAIRIESPCREGSRKALDTWFNGAAGLPLSLTISGSLQGDQVVPALVKRHAHRLQNLQLNLLCGEELEAITMPFVSLKSLTISQGKPIKNAPQRYLSSRSRNENDYYSYDPSECVEMLCAAPNLVECTFEGFQHEVEDSYGVSPMPNTYSTHLCLKHLLLGTEGSDYSSTAEILKHLTLPALESLAMKFRIAVPDFLAFLTRSSPPLRSLKLTIRSYVRWGTVDTESIFQLIPSLTHLELTFERYRPGTEPFESFVIHPLRETSLLRNLNSLTIRAPYPPDRPKFKKLVDALAARRASASPKLSSFTLLYPKRAEEEQYRQGVCGQSHRGDLEEDVLSTLQALAVDGMEIHVGPEGANRIQRGFGLD